MVSWLGVGTASASLIWIYYEVVTLFLLPSYYSSTGLSWWHALLIFVETWTLLVALFCLWKMVIEGPGYANQHWHPGTGDVDPIAEDFCVQVCAFCSLYRPLRSNHCRICNRCVLRHEFHSWHYDICVGYRNFKYYMLFVWNSSCLASNAYWVISYWWMNNVFFSDSHWMDAMINTPDIMWNSFLGTVCFWVAIYFTVLHAFCWGGLIGNTTYSELGAYKRFMSKKSKAEQKMLRKKDKMTSTEWNFGLATPEYQPVWPYALQDTYANVRQVLGARWWQWFIPSGPPPNTSGSQFNIHPRWYELNLTPDERAQYVYPASVDDIIEQMRRDQNPSMYDALSHLACEEEEEEEHDRIHDADHDHNEPSSDAMVINIESNNRG